MNYLLKIVKGALIGVANAIPGVSGGTMMVSMGIYDDIISSINSLFKNFKKSFLTLLPYLIGMALGIVGLSFCIKYFFQNFPLQTAFVFIGLIFGGIPPIFKNVKKHKIGALSVILFIVFCAGIIGMQFLGGGSDASLATLSMKMYIALFFVGMIASATMIIPGVSGSLVLMILGFYTPIITTISTFVTALAQRDSGAILHCFGIIIPTGLGIVAGIILVSKLIDLLLKKFEGPTYSAILGLVVASPIIVILQMEYMPKLNILTVITTILAFGVGWLITQLLGKEEKTSEKNKKRC